MLPPMAGRVWSKLPDPSSMSRSVQSAVRPACVRMETCGMRVRPDVVAAAMMISGVYVSMSFTRTLLNVSAVKCASAGSSTT